MKRSLLNLLNAAAMLALCMACEKNNSIHAQSGDWSSIEQHTYAATRNGKKIGWMRTECKRRPGECLVATESELLIKVILSFQARATTCTRFEDNAVVHATVYRTVDKKVKLDNQLQLINGNYKVVKGECKVPVFKSISTTATSLYFFEPLNVSELFSEVYLCFLKIEKIANSVYQVHLPDGGIMTYHYTSGKLVQVVARTNYATVLFKLVQ